MYGLFEDEDDILLGSPKSKLMDVIFHANNDRVRYELENFINRTAALEMILEKQIGENYNDEVRALLVSDKDGVQNQAKSLYIELMGDIVSQSE